MLLWLFILSVLKIAMSICTIFAYFSFCSYWQLSNMHSILFPLTCNSWCYLPQQGSTEQEKYSQNSLHHSSQCKVSLPLNIPPWLSDRLSLLFSSSQEHPESPYRYQCMGYLWHCPKVWELWKKQGSIILVTLAFETLSRLGIKRYY